MILSPRRKKYKVGEWVNERGSRIKFSDIKPNHYYIADYSPNFRKLYKVVYAKWVKDDEVGYVDAEKGIKGKWSWGNSYSAMTRKMYVDRERQDDKGEVDTNGWWYELP